MTNFFPTLVLNWSFDTNGPRPGGKLDNAVIRNEVKFGKFLTVVGINVPIALKLIVFSW